MENVETLIYLLLGLPLLAAANTLFFDFQILNMSCFEVPMIAPHARKLTSWTLTACR